MYYSEKGVLPPSQTYFALASDTVRAMHFYIERVGHFYCDKNYSAVQSSHDHFFLLYVKEGCGLIRNGDRISKLKAGDVALAGHIPYEYAAGPNGWELIWMEFNGCSSRQMYEYLFDKAAGVVDVAGNIIIPKYLNRILATFESGDSICEPILSCYIHRVLSEIILIVSKCGYCEGREEISPSLDVIHYIENNYANKITLEELSEKVSMSTYYFSRVFKKETGFSPYEYILSVRINHSKNMLRSTRLSVKEISHRVGFNSESNFVQTFRKRTGMTPNDFRLTPLEAIIPHCD